MNRRLPFALYDVADIKRSCRPIEKVPEQMLFGSMDRRAINVEIAIRCLDHNVKQAMFCSEAHSVIGFFLVRAHHVLDRLACSGQNLPLFNHDLKCGPQPFKRVSHLYFSNKELLTSASSSSVKFHVLAARCSSSSTIPFKSVS